MLPAEQIQKCLFCRHLLENVKTLLVLIAGLAIVAAPFTLYAGEVFCEIQKIAPPKYDTFLIAAITGISTILYFAFQRKKDRIEDKPNDESK